VYIIRLLNLFSLKQELLIRTEFPRQIRNYSVTVTQINSDCAVPKRKQVEIKKHDMLN